jgi:FixJ family two-component response regulator
VSKTRPVIAVVNDKEPVRIALRRLLRSVSLDVETFPSGAGFLKSLKTHQPDCVVLDPRMLLVNGYSVQPRLAHAVIVITGHDVAETRERALAGGASAFLRQQLDGQTLLDATPTAIAHRHLKPASLQNKAPLE